MGPNFDVLYWQNDDEQWNWHARATNGNVLCQSTQGYENQGDMLGIIEDLFGAEGRGIEVRQIDPPS